MWIGVQSVENPDIGFIVEINEQIDKAKELIKHGFECWICLGSVSFPTEYFNEDDYDWIECSGYSEPSTELLEQFNIPYGKVYECFNKDGELKKSHIKKEIEWVY